MSTKQNESDIDEVASAISTLGIGRKKASVLAYLMSHREVTQHEIERAMDLRQPEVSNYLKEFTIKRWIGVESTYKEASARGRGANVYTLQKDPGVIARELRDAYIDRTKISESVRLISKIKST